MVTGKAEGEGPAQPGPGNDRRGVLGEKLARARNGRRESVQRLADRRWVVNAVL
jgi:hypothetical protein